MPENLKKELCIEDFQIRSEQLCFERISECAGWSAHNAHIAGDMGKYQFSCRQSTTCGLVYTAIKESDSNDVERGHPDLQVCVMTVLFSYQS